MSRTYNNMTELVNAASAQDCMVHMHLDDQGKPVFSVGNSNTGAAEFSDYFAALEYISDPLTYTAGDCAEIAGGDIGRALLNDTLAADSQTQRAILIQSAIVKVARLEHQDRAAAGFAAALVNVLEIGLQHLPKGGK